MLIQKACYWGSRPIVNTYVQTMLQMDVQKHAPFPEGAKIIAPNHPSTTDPFFVASMLGQQCYIMITEIMFKVPVMGAYLRRSGHIPVCEGKGQQAIDAALEYLKEGKTVVIFPEGLLSPLPGGFHKARTGVARLAIASGAPVIPVGIHLQRERMHAMQTVVDGKVEDSQWYLRGPYSITTGTPLRFNGDVENREYVRYTAQNIMHHIIELAHESQERLDRSSGRLIQLPDLSNSVL